jgi:hypothetical protein
MIPELAARQARGIIMRVVPLFKPAFSFQFGNISSSVEMPLLKADNPFYIDDRYMSNYKEISVFRLKLALYISYNQLR